MSARTYVCMCDQSKNSKGKKYSAVFNSAVADKNRRIAEIKTPQKLPAIRYLHVQINLIG